MYNKEIEKLPLPKLRQLQNSSLQTLLERIPNVPFYQNKFQNEGVNIKNIRSVEDLHLLPITHKNDLRDNYPFGLFAQPITDIRRIHASSGTTGKPTVVGYNQNDLDVFDEVVARSLACGGARKGMRLHNAYGYGLFTGGLGLHGGATKLGMAVIPVSGGMTERQLTLLTDFQPEVICCTPSYALTLGEELKKKNLSANDLNLSYAILGAEPWTETVRAGVEEMLGLTATNIYGLSEIIGPGVSQEDFEEKGTGSYIWEDHFYPEILDRDTGEPLAHGKEGVLVFTTLSKQAMPLLRYWTNDICSIDYDPDGKRTHIKMSTIKGRADDMLIIRGVNLFHTQVEELISGHILLSANYQLVVQRSGAMDNVRVKVEVNDNEISIERKNEIQSQLAHKIKENIGLSMEVEICDVETIPRSTGGKLNRILDLRNEA